MYHFTYQKSDNEDMHIYLSLESDFNQKKHIETRLRFTSRTTDDEGFVPTDRNRPRVDPRGGVNRDARPSLSIRLSRRWTSAPKHRE